MAIAARCYSSYAPAFSQQCLKAALAAWNWCQSNPNVFFKNPPDIRTAEFGDTDCHDELLWAAAELRRTTGDQAFHQAFMGMLPQPLATIKIELPSATQVASLGYWSYALAGRNRSDAAVAAIQQATLKTARELVHQSSENGYGNSLALEDYAGGSNAVVANHSLLLLIANQFEPDSSHLDCALNNLHYLLAATVSVFHGSRSWVHTPSSIRIIGLVSPTISLRHGRVYYQMGPMPIPRTRSLRRCRAKRRCVCMSTMSALIPATNQSLVAMPRWCSFSLHFTHNRATDE